MCGLSTGPIPDPTRTPNRKVANRRPQIEHIIRGRHCGDDLVFVKDYGFSSLR